MVLTLIEIKLQLTANANQRRIIQNAVHINSSSQGHERNSMGLQFFEDNKSAPIHSLSLGLLTVLLPSLDLVNGSVV